MLIRIALVRVTNRHLARPSTTLGSGDNRGGGRKYSPPPPGDECSAGGPGGALVRYRRRNKLTSILTKNNVT